MHQFRMLTSLALVIALASAPLSAKAGATSENPDFALAGNWIEAIVAVDRQDHETADQVFNRLVELDDDIDTVQQASLATDQSILEVRQARSDEGISCGR